jgi:hypothetical protein
LFSICRVVYSIVTLFSFPFPLAARLAGFGLGAGAGGGGGGGGAVSGAIALVLVALPTAAAAVDGPGSSSMMITFCWLVFLASCFFTRRIIYKTVVKSPHYFLVKIKMDYDIPADPVELKRLHAYCQRLYYHSVPPEKQKVMQDKQRIKASPKYQTDPVYAEKVKEYKKDTLSS